jgi:hypothetical protein
MVLSESGQLPVVKCINFFTLLLALNGRFSNNLSVLYHSLLHAIYKYCITVILYLGFHLKKKNVNYFMSNFCHYRSDYISVLKEKVPIGL